MEAIGAELVKLVANQPEGSTFRIDAFGNERENQENPLKEPEGREQAEKIGRALAKHWKAKKITYPLTITHSHYLRARQTAEIIASGFTEARAGKRVLGERDKLKGAESKIRGSFIRWITQNRIRIYVEHSENINLLLVNGPGALQAEAIIFKVSGNGPTCVARVLYDKW